MGRFFFKQKTLKLSLASIHVYFLYSIPVEPLITPASALPGLFMEKNFIIL